MTHAAGWSSEPINASPGQPLTRQRLAKAVPSSSVCHQEHQPGDVCCPILLPASLEQLQDHPRIIDLILARHCQLGQAGVRPDLLKSGQGRIEWLQAAVDDAILHEFGNRCTAIDLHAERPVM
jgi:hypothetical protein